MDSAFCSSSLVTFLPANKAIPHEGDHCSSVVKEYFLEIGTELLFNFFHVIDCLSVAFLDFLLIFPARLFAESSISSSVRSTYVLPVSPVLLLIRAVTFVLICLEAASSVWNDKVAATAGLVVPLAPIEPLLERYCITAKAWFEGLILFVDHFCKAFLYRIKN
jgi:hypothetical protein